MGALGGLRRAERLPADLMLNLSPERSTDRISPHSIRSGGSVTPPARSSAACWSTGTAREAFRSLEAIGSASFRAFSSSAGRCGVSARCSCCWSSNQKRGEGLPTKVVRRGGRNREFSGRRHVGLRWPLLADVPSAAKRSLCDGVVANSAKTAGFGLPNLTEYPPKRSKFAMASKSPMP